MPGHAVIQMAAHREAFGTAMRAGRRSRLAMLCGRAVTRRFRGPLAVTCGRALIDRSVLAPQLFEGTGDQVRSVRDFVRASSAGHPMNAVLVACELATNAIAHNASGQPGGRFMIHLANCGTESLIVMVTSPGGPRHPHTVDADADAEPGRGLAVVEPLATYFTWSDNDPLRSVLAVLPADSPGNACMCWHAASRQGGVPGDEPQLRPRWGMAHARSGCDG
jgi:anti-sigma regulatory factor (Ser/Thr protein kinase)